MGTLWVAMLWTASGTMCAVLVRFWAGAWQWEMRRGVRVLITVTGAAAAFFAVSIPTAIEDGWMFTLGRTSDQVARAGVLAAIAILSWSRVADQSRGRRRCPRCWYDMSGTPGLVCGECGRDAGDEARLFLARPRWRIALLALVPLAMGAGIALVSFVRDPAWARRLPDAAVAVASFAAAPGTVLTEQVLARAGKLDAPERALQRVVSRAVLARTQDSGRVLIHAQALHATGVFDAGMTARLVPLTLDSKADVRVATARLLGGAPEGDAIAERTLLSLLADGSQPVRDEAFDSLITIKRRSPGGPPPPEVLAALAPRRFIEDGERGSVLLAFYDVTETSREVVFDALEWAGEYPSPWMVIAALQLSPDDPRTSKALATVVPSEYVIEALIVGDRAARGSDGQLSGPHRALYSNDLVLRRLYDRVLYSNRTDWITWYVEHPELRNDVRISMLKVIQYRPEFTRVVLAQAALLGPEGEPFRDLARQKADDPVHGPAARRALEAMGAAPAPRPAPSTIGR